MIDPRRPGPSRPPVRLRPAPAYDPPFVDEGSEWPGPADGQLALDLFSAPHWSPGSGPARPPHQRVTVRPTPARPGRDPVRQLPPGALTTATPGATRVAHRFVASCIEVFNGFRPPVQLRRQLDPARCAHLLPELARGSARAVGTRRRTPRPGLRLRRLRVCEPRPNAIEAAAVLTGVVDASWAMALRLEHRRGTWLCTDLRIL
ncbi:Rv3235 family protein [Micromonospora sp. NPDC048871]|uniref:Rv3235 family protein n=1 Tax=unclassified Micromonospora TaxID=2617518 RepID=UPI002E139ABF|nr:Rv3235 family protein [Micromonospora sp. NBC_01739]